MGTLFILYPRLEKRDFKISYFSVGTRTWSHALIAAQPIVELVSQVLSSQINRDTDFEVLQFIKLNAIYIRIM
jgi:hypothetical protein